MLPSAPTNGIIVNQTGNSVSVGESITLKCHVNYYFADLDLAIQVLRCEVGRVWSQPALTACVGNLEH